MNRNYRKVTGTNRSSRTGKKSIRRQTKTYEEILRLRELPQPTGRPLRFGAVNGKTVLFEVRSGKVQAPRMLKNQTSRMYYQVGDLYGFKVFPGSRPPPGWRKYFAKKEMTVLRLLFGEDDRFASFKEFTSFSPGATPWSGTVQYKQYYYVDRNKNTRIDKRELSKTVERSTSLYNLGVTVATWDSYESIGELGKMVDGYLKGISFVLQNAFGGPVKQFGKAVAKKYFKHRTKEVAKRASVIVAKNIGKAAIAFGKDAGKSILGSPSAKDLRNPKKEDVEKAIFAGADAFAASIVESLFSAMPQIKEFSSWLSKSESMQNPIKEAMLVSFKATAKQLVPAVSKAMFNAGNVATQAPRGKQNAAYLKALPPEMAKVMGENIAKDLVEGVVETLGF